MSLDSCWRLSTGMAWLVGSGFLGLLMACSGQQETAWMSGYAEAELVYLAPSVGGVLQTLSVQRGDQVHRGQALYALEAESESLERRAAAARVERNAAQAENLRKGMRPHELKVFEQQLLQAQAALANSAAQFERHQPLVGQGFISTGRLDELSAARDRDLARVRELQAQLVVARDAARSDEIAAAQAATRASQAELAQAIWRENQKHREAPIDALVYDVMYRVGEWVPAGAPVVALQPADAVKVRFFVPQAQLSLIKVGQEVELSCDGCSSELRASIRHVSPQAEYTPPIIYSNQSRSKLVFMVEATPLAQTRADLKPGQPVDVRLVGVKRESS